MCSLGHAKDFLNYFFKLVESKNVRFLFTPLSTVRCLMNTTLVFLPTSWDWVLHCWVWGLYSDTSQECSPGGSNLQCDQSFDRTGSNMCVDWSVSSAALYSATNLHACVTWILFRSTIAPRKIKDSRFNIANIFHCAPTFFSTWAQKLFLVEPCSSGWYLFSYVDHFLCTRPVYSEQQCLVMCTLFLMF